MATTTPTKSVGTLSTGSTSALSPSASPSVGLSPASKDAATKTRIISHMNADHADSLTRYIEHYGSRPSFAAREPRLLAFSLESMTLSSAGVFSPATTEIPFDPPLKSLSEARTRLIEMDKAASKAMGKEPETIKRYELPPHFGGWLFVAVAWVVNSQQANWAKGAWMDRAGLKYVPGFRAFGESTQPYVLGFMLFTHVAEAIYMGWRLGKYTVPMGSEVWLKWVASTLFEGFPVWNRLKGVILEEKTRREKTMH